LIEGVIVGPALNEVRRSDRITSKVVEACFSKYRPPRAICTCTDATERRKSRPQGEFIVLKQRVILCLAVKDGRIVRGVNFVSLLDAGDPVEQATGCDGNGAGSPVRLVARVV